MPGTRSVGVVVVVLCTVLTHVPPVVSPPSSDDQDVTLTRADPREGRGLDPLVASPIASSGGRVRREADYTNREVEEFSEEEKRILVQEHNNYRAKQISSDMMYMYWDDDLASLAKTWVKGCAFKHSPKSMRQNVGSYPYVGENLYASTGSYDPAVVMKGWYEEIKFYDYQTKGCSGVCGHYTQMVWAKSHAIGCAVRYCPTLTDVHFGKGFLVSCNYGPGGNYNNRRPYQRGKACSACGEDTPYCVQDMCARVPLVGAASRGGPSLTVIGCSIMMSLGVVSWIMAPSFSP